jgi:transglutaminase-like putative cysteine protease
MQIRAGYSLTYDCPQPTPMLLCLNIHPSRRVDLLTPQTLQFEPPAEAWDYTDGFGNVCTRITAPIGRTTISTQFDIYDTGTPDYVPYDAVQHDIHNLPDDVLVFLLGSRYSETDRLTNIAWGLFGNTPPGWPRVQAILNYVHNHITFNYQRSDPWRSAYWYTADARHNKARIGRILMAIGRDATDVALSTQFGPAVLSSFNVVTDEIVTPG